MPSGTRKAVYSRDLSEQQLPCMGEVERQEGRGRGKGNLKLTMRGGADLVGGGGGCVGVGGCNELHVASHTGGVRRGVLEEISEHVSLPGDLLHQVL